MLNPDCIQERLFTGDLAGIDLLARFPSTTPDDEYSSAHKELIRRSLITHSDQKMEFRVHRVLQYSIRSEMTSERMLETFIFALKLVLTAWGDTPLVQRHVLSLARNRDSLFPLALALHSIFKEHYNVNHPEWSINFAKLMNESAWYVLLCLYSMTKSIL